MLMIAPERPRQAESQLKVDSSVACEQGKHDLRDPDMGGSIGRL